MKKIVTLMLCLGAISPVFSQKALVDQAKKLSGKADKLEEARSMIKQAMQNSDTQNDALTYFVAGKIELDAFNNANTIKKINPDDASAKSDVMADELIMACEYFNKAIDLEKIPDAKGKVSNKITKDILKLIDENKNNIYDAGVYAYQDQFYYPQAYKLFMIFGNLPQSELGQGIKDKDKDQQLIANAFYNAGVAASQNNQTEESLEAFKSARLAGFDKPEATIYEIACWQTIAQQDESRSNEAQNNIKEVAQFGIEKFGLDNPMFINNLINSMVNSGESNQALAKLGELIASNPDQANLYGLRGYVYDRMDNLDMAEADYRKAASSPNVDYETLLNASKTLFRIGTAKNNDLQGSEADTRDARQNIKTNYFETAKAYAEKADQMKPGQPAIQSLLDSIDYALSTYFN